MMQLAFCHAMLDGEHLMEAMKYDMTVRHPDSDYSYYNILTLDRVRAEYMGHNLGYVPIFLPEFTRACEGSDVDGFKHFMEEPAPGIAPEPNEVLHLLGLIILHDIVPFNAYSNTAAYHHWWAVQDVFGWDDSLERLPYWNNDTYVTSITPSDPDIICTLYRGTDRVMIAAMNNTDTDTAVTIQLDAAALGFPSLANASVLDAWKAADFDYERYSVYLDGANNIKVDYVGVGSVTGTDELIPLTNGVFTTTIGKRNFRIFTWFDDSTTVKEWMLLD
jgi:hypothetical protein